MARTTVRSDDGRNELEVCDQCSFFLDGVRNCGYCGEPKCPICGCLCGGGERDPIDLLESYRWDDEYEQGGTSHD